MAVEKTLDDESRLIVWQPKALKRMKYWFFSDGTFGVLLRLNLLFTETGRFNRFAKTLKSFFWWGIDISCRNNENATGEVVKVIL